MKLLHGCADLAHRPRFTPKRGFDNFPPPGKHRSQDPNSLNPAINDLFSGLGPLNWERTA
jgi:hypothetical protein